METKFLLILECHLLMGVSGSPNIFQLSRVLAVVVGGEVPDVGFLPTIFGSNITVCASASGGQDQQCWYLVGYYCRLLVEYGH